MNRNRINVEMNRDETFLDLLSSQRQLLAQLTQENGRAAAEPNYTQAGFGGGGGGFPNTSPASVQQYHSFVAPNRSICEPSIREGLLVHRKRFSLGIRGNDMINVPPSFMGDDQTKSGISLGFDSLGCDALLAGDMNNISSRKRDKDDFGFDDFPAVKRRRFSGTGLLFLDDLPLQHFQQNGQRRLSMSSLADSRSLVPSFPDTSFMEDEDLMHTFDVKFELPKQRQFQPFFSPPPPRRPQQRPPSLGPQETRKLMICLSEAMEKTQKSQQNIHDWDKKMGLKRSHSKTMRLSMRSRKKLRSMLKKKINALSSKKR